MTIFKALNQLEYDRFFKEDDLHSNLYYINTLPSTEVSCLLKIKSDVLMSGLPYFFGAFQFLDNGLPSFEEIILKYEGKEIKKGATIQFKLPFSVALSGERVALNLLQQSTRVSTYTSQFVQKAKDSGVKILDTRKTTPGLRTLEKYAVRMGGGYNHRFSQTDIWMIKDNHKTFFGGLEKAIDFFNKTQALYQNMIVEIHSIDELVLAKSLGIKHVMLDNFSPENLYQAIELKGRGMTYEVSGGIHLNNMESFLLKGIDALSIGALTHSAPHVDLSMKISHEGIK